MFRRRSVLLAVIAFGVCLRSVSPAAAATKIKVENPLGFHTSGAGESFRELWESWKEQRKMAGKVSDHLTTEQIASIIVLEVHIAIAVGPNDPGVQGEVLAFMTDGNRFETGRLPVDFVKEIRQKYITALFRTKSGDYGLISRYKNLAIVELNGLIGVAPIVSARTTRSAVSDSKPEAVKTLTDDQRLTLLKPVMTLEEITRLRYGKTLHGQTCGEGLDKRSGKVRGVYGNVYLLELANSPEARSMTFSYFQGDDGYHFEVTGPGFRYERQSDKFVAVEGPPAQKAASPESPVASQPPVRRLDVTGMISENGGRLISRQDSADGEKVLHGLQVLVGPHNSVQEFAVLAAGNLELRHQFYPNGRAFRSQMRDPSGDGHEIVYTAELTKVIAEKVIVDGGVNIGPIKEQDLVCRGTVRANHRWSGTFLVWEPIPNGFGERLMLREYRKGDLVNSTPFRIEKLALPADPAHEGSAAWPWRWSWDSPEWRHSPAWPSEK